MKNLLTAIIVLIVFSSCSNYYKAILAPQPVNASTITDIKMKDKYFILRTGSEAFAMKNISVSNDRKNVQCTLEELPFEHQLYFKTGTVGKMKYKTKDGNTDEDETAVLNEVHIYLVPGIKTETGPYTLALENVRKEEIIEKDKIKTKKSHVTGTVIGVSSAVVFVGIVVAIIAASSLSFGIL